MRNHISYPAIGLALLAGTSLAHAQTVETVIAPPSGTIYAQQPVVVTQPAPTETVETVRTVRSTTTHTHRMASRPVVTTTRTTVRERVVPTPAVEAITQPGYTEVVQAPVTYQAPLYDVVPGMAVTAPAIVGQPVGGAAVVTPVPAYRYVYEPDRILVIDANTGITVQALPR
jgi:hypothetical protein